MYDIAAFLVLSMIALALAGVLGRRQRWVSPRLLMAAVVLRIVGSTLRYEVLERFYGGVGDAKGYYGYGLRMAERLWELDLGGFFPDVLFGGRWWGTQFLRNLSGIAVSLVGPSLRAEFLLFSLAAFVGLYALAVSFTRYYPPEVAQRYAAYIWLWPSLWFWPSSVGKEAVVILGIGVTVLGYAGRKGKPTWWMVAVGLGLVFCIRPHFAFVIALSGAAAAWLGSWRRFSPRRFIELALALLLAFFAFRAMLAQFGLGEADLEGMQEFAEFRAEQSLKGGSNIGATALTGASLPLAVVNVWFRPFLFEAHNPMAAFAALEILLFWYLVWKYRKGVALVVRRWRQSRLISFAVPFIAMYTLMIGMVMGNLGLLARQRSPLFPFAFMVVATGAVLVPQHKRIRRRSIVKDVSSPNQSEIVR